MAGHGQGLAETTSGIAPFTPYLLRRWDEGHTNVLQLHREITAQGYTSLYAPHVRLTPDSVKNIDQAHLDEMGAQLWRDAVSKTADWCKANSAAGKGFTNVLSTVKVQIGDKYVTRLVVITSQAGMPEDLRRLYEDEFDAAIYQATPPGD
ncbi:hypothetical protein ABH920_001933 [Catenulispora sp. EB89]|uniref:hypothetical protein n=1 Tax=Catenulispora sp. EB89 TaxID=3156257 RepID=UPI0035123D4F